MLLWPFYFLAFSQQVEALVILPFSLVQEQSEVVLLSLAIIE